MSGGIREMVWHFCDSCGGRLTPFTKFEAQTEAPDQGKNGRRILLSSFNTKDPDHRIAWCLSERKWVSVTRVGEDEIWAMYLNRRTVPIRERKLRQLVRLPRGVHARRTA